MNNAIQSALERFNPQQKEAATNTLGPMLVIAGAGSGKTSVLTTRIALLIEQGVMPERILALTFTKKAADEMRKRIIQMTGPEARRVCMGTFHSVFIRFLRPFANRVYFPTNFTILDEEDSSATLKRCIRDILDEKRPDKKEWTVEQKKRYAAEDAAYKPKTVASIISKAKNELVTCDDYAKDEETTKRDILMHREKMADIFKHYQSMCHRMAMMDFDDILLYTDILLNNCPDVLAQIAGSFDYILVDEYQDTNYAQYSILRRLTWINKNICVVGDDSQSIYAFRGARIQNIINFMDDYKGAKEVKLTQNYRSTKTIVNAANNLISKNEGRIPKTCFADSEKGAPIKFMSCETEKTEAAFIAKMIKGKKSELGHYSDIAVLYRTNAQSRALEDALVKARIPYIIYSGTSFFERMEVKDLMACFKLAVNPHDNESFRRSVKKLTEGFGDMALARLSANAELWNQSLWDACHNPQIEFCGFGPKAMNGLMEFIKMIEDFRHVAETKTAYEAAKYIDDETGYYKAYAEEDDEDSRKRADNLRELVDSVKSYEEDMEANKESGAETEENNLAGYLQNIMLLSNADTSDDGKDKVNLMTVHCAKGLEFECVFVAGMEENLFPLELEGTQFEEEEERRLFYVAVTRAKKELYLTSTKSRLRFGKRTEADVSHFVAELSKKA